MKTPVAPNDKICDMNTLSKQSEPLIDIIHTIRSLGELLQAAKAGFEEAIRPWKEAVEAIPEEQRQALGFVISNFSISELIEEFNHDEYETEQRVCDILAKREWWVRLDEYFTWVELKKIAEMGGSDIQSISLDAFICNKFCLNDWELLQREIDSWWRLPYLSDRRSIITDAVIAHKKGLYTLSIPALLPFVDGLALDISFALPVADKVELKSLEKPKSGRGVEHVRKIAQLYHQSETEWVKKTFGDWQDSLWSGLVEQAITARVYQSFEPSAKRFPSVLNRHAILHGRIADYPSESNSLRVFLLLGAFVHAATILQTRHPEGEVKA
jgi:hypothetical protein